MTWKEAWKRGAQSLQKAGVEEYDLDAWYLLEHVTGITKASYYMEPEHPMHDQEEREYLELIRKRSTRIPLQHLTGVQEFMGLEFLVNEHVLIPRQDTEVLVETALDVCKQEQMGEIRLLDMCTGSGCLAILLAEKFPQAEVDAVDISSEALEVAEINIADYELENRVYPIQSDLFENLQNTKYDLIISNPPYVTESSMEGLPQEYRYEPSLALVAGADGMDIIDRLLKEVKAHLNDNGVLIVELGDGAENFKERFPNIEVTWLPTSGGKDQVFMIKKEQLPNA